MSETVTDIEALAALLEAANLTVESVDDLVGDDLRYWLRNPFMDPATIEAKVCFWVTTALANAALPALLAEVKASREERARVEQILFLACHHCGRLPEGDGDHACPCPTPDSECLLHTADPVAPLEPIRAALGSAS